MTVCGSQIECAATGRKTSPVARTCSATCAAPRSGCAWCGGSIGLTPNAKRRGRKGPRRFCSSSCKVAFFRLAREIGAALLDAFEGPARNWRTNSVSRSAAEAHTSRELDGPPPCLPRPKSVNSSTPGLPGNTSQPRRQRRELTPWDYPDQEALRRGGRRQKRLYGSPTVIPVVTLQEACDRLCSPLPTLDLYGTPVDAPVDDTLAQQMAEFIVGIVKQTGDYNHEALTRAAEDHCAQDVAILLSLCAVAVPGKQVVDKLTNTVNFEADPGADLDAFVKPYVPALALAKKKAAVELAGGEKVTPALQAANNKPASGKPLKAPSARRVQTLP